MTWVLWTIAGLLALQALAVIYPADLRLTCRGYALTLQLRRRWRLYGGAWWGGRTAWLRVGPVMVAVKVPRWEGDER